MTINWAIAISSFEVNQDDIYNLLDKFLRNYETFVEMNDLPHWRDFKLKREDRNHIVILATNPFGTAIDQHVIMIEVSPRKVATGLSDTGNNYDYSRRMLESLYQILTDYLKGELSDAPCVPLEVG